MPRNPPYILYKFIVMVLLNPTTKFYFIFSCSSRFQTLPSKLKWYSHIDTKGVSRIGVRKKRTCVWSLCITRRRGSLEGNKHRGCVHTAAEKCQRLISRRSGCSVSYHSVSRSNASTLVLPVIVVSSCIIEETEQIKKEKNRGELKLLSILFICLFRSSQYWCLCIFFPLICGLFKTPLMVVTLGKLIEFLFNVNNFVGSVSLIIWVDFTFV